MSHVVSSHPVLPHQWDNAGRRARLGQEGVFEKLAGRGPLSRVAHKHPLQEAFEQRGHLNRKELSSGQEVKLPSAQHTDLISLL